MGGHERPIAVLGGDVMLPQKLARGRTLVVRGGTVDAILAPGRPPPQDAHVIDATGLTTLPGFIDIHCHGGGGAGFDSATPDQIDTILATHARHGTTAIVSALPALARERRQRALRTLRERASQGRPGQPELLGAYIEGPYLSPQERGAQPESVMGPPSPADFMPTLDQFGDFIKVWSLAPELPGSTEFITTLSNNSIVPAIGHSNASHEHILAGIDAGARLVTHVYCAHSTFHRDVADKKLGVGEMALLRDELAVELIPDGKHLPPLLLQLVLKNKRPDQSCVITDAMPAAGLPPGAYDFLGTSIRVTSEVAYRPDGLRYAGSVLTMDRALRNIVLQGGASLQDAVTMLSTTPAILGAVRDRKGAIEAGKDADLVLVDQHLRVRQVLCRGARVDHPGDA